jgi:acyl-CoA synthetase (AMP-forming)/AMP-acid ligase II
MEKYGLAGDFRDCGGLLPVIPDREQSPALRDASTGVWRTRAELRKAALTVGDALAAERKRVVFVLADQNPGGIVAILASASAGHAVALIDPSMAETKIAALIESYRPELILAAKAERLAWLSDRGYGPARPLAENVFLSERTEKPDDAPAIDPSLLLLLATSGTTGAPRLVRLAQSAVIANALQIAQSLDIGVESVGVAHLPFHYSYGWSVVASHLIKGAGVAVLDDNLMSTTFWESIAKAGGTHFPGVPFHYATIARLGLKLIPECVTTFTQAGGALDVKVQKRMHDFAEGRGARFFVMYGQTEAAPRMTTLPHSRFEAKAGSVGLALPGGRIGIEKDGAALGPGENGDVVYRGPNVMLGYADERSDLAKGDELGGRLETGDVGTLDGEGFLFLTGRTKRFAKIAGLRLGLDQMEKEFHSVGVVACIDGGEKILVFFDETTESLLKERARAIAAEYKIPPTSFSLRRVEAIPRLTGGKVNYALLKEAAHV